MNIQATNFNEKNRKEKENELFSLKKKRKGK